MTIVNYRLARLKRHKRVRLKVSGTAERPRLCVFRSLNHIYAQVIDDIQKNTLAAASSLDPEILAQLKGKTKQAEAEIVGALVGKRAKENGIKELVFDRGGYQYHGRVKALAEAVRKEGLIF
ncbi:MAG: 50S ribosomal protein L18 [Dehalococcoidales bacterium]|jgi:large subunit ribosomal protein L18